MAAERAHVIIIDHNVEFGNQAVARIEQAGGKAIFMEADIADDAVKAIDRSVADQFPPLHFLVNNAAIVRQGMIEDGG